MVRKKSWVTMADVAKEAGVGTITVSRALRTPSKVSTAKRKRIMEAVSKLGYVLDEGAGGLSSKSTRAVGALVSTLTESTFGRTIDGLSSGLRRSGYQLLLASTQYSSETEEDFLRTLLSRRPEGLVLTESVHTDTAEALLQRSGIPVVEVWEIPENSAYHAVGFSNREAAYAIVNHLVERGYRNIGLLGNVAGSDQRVAQRLAGYSACLRDFGLGPERIVKFEDNNMTGVERGARELSTMLAIFPDVDAVFCVNDYIAFGALCEAQRRGIDVPGKLAVAGFGNFDISSDGGAGLTTVDVSGVEIGEQAALLLLETMKTPMIERKTIDVGFKVVHRKSS